MGELSKQQRSAQGTKRSATDSQAIGAALPIFMGPAFDPNVHRIPCWLTIVGHKPGTFDGEDRLGWGVHPIGLVDCINIPICRQFNLKSPQSFSTLWDMEATAQERVATKYRPQDGYLKMMKRLIVHVRLDFTAIQFIPDPEVWNIYVPLDLTPTSVRSGQVGRLVPKSGLTERLQEARDSILSRARRKAGLCLK